LDAGHKLHTSACANTRAPGERVEQAHDRALDEERHEQTRREDAQEDKQEDADIDGNEMERLPESVRLGPATEAGRDVLEVS